MTNNNNNYVVIMAGGIGSRFWPFSRTKSPKQFHDVLGVGKTLLQQTAERFTNVCPPENIYIVTNKDYKDLVKKQLPFLNDDQVLLEPIGRNTAPCVAYACYKIQAKNPAANIVVSPSDHIIMKEQVFENVILTALEETQNKDILITLGITPSRPDTGYGYIQYKEGSGPIHKVKTFTEKPQLEMAKTFLESGDFVWNAGIFVWNVQSITKKIKQFLPELSLIFEKGKETYYSSAETDYINTAYSQCTNISIDFGIMEKADNVHVLLCEFGWSDLGTWKSLFESQEKNRENNVLDGNIMTYNTTNSIIKTPKNKLVVVQGLDGYIVAEYDDVIMICKKDEEQKVKDFVADVKARKDCVDYI
ncbi:MAG: mannose-phosphate guanylyltransferase [Bacteroidota bacterium]